MLCEVGADHDATGSGEPAIHHDLVTDSLCEEIRDRVLDAELADDAMEFRGGHGVGRHHVIEVEDDAARVPERQIEASEGVDGERAGDVVRHRNVHLGDDRVTRVHLTSQAAAEQFLGDGSHIGSSRPLTS